MVENTENNQAEKKESEGNSEEKQKDSAQQNSRKNSARRDDQKNKKYGRNRRSRKREREEKEFEEEVIDIARVTRVVKGGRRLRFRATIIVGDRKGRVGLGTGKSTEVASAIRKGVSAAKKNLITVNLDEGTIPHELKWKHKSARILLMPAKAGTGIIAGGALRKIADLAGIENILGKSYGTNNKLVNAQAMMQALDSFPEVEEKKTPEKEEVKA